MSGVVRAIASAAIVAVATAVGGPIGTAIAKAVVAIGNQIIAPSGNGQRRQAQELALSIGEVPRQAIFGEVLTGGSLVDAFNYGGKYGTDWEVLVIALADHRCDALVGFYVNDKFVNYGGDGVVPGYNNQLEIYYRSGTETQTVPSILTSHGPGWTANDNGAGVAFAVVAYRADKADAKNPVWPSGRPRFAFRLRGMRCYDSRLDSTVPGGSGTHRRATPSTWQWSDNPIVCRYNWVRGIYACDRVTDPTQLLVGRGLSDVEAPPGNVAAHANICDELVALDAGGTERRYRASGKIDADETFAEVEDFFAGCTGGVIIQPEGSVEVEPGHAKPSVFFFSDEDLIIGSAVSFDEYRSLADDEWVNTVIPRYIEPAQRFADHGAPLRRVNADLIADGGSREKTLSLPFVTSSTQAGRVGEISRRLGRLFKTASVTLGPRFAEVEEGDWGTWTSARYLGGQSVQFRVEAYQIGGDWRNTLRLREISPTVYAKDADAASSAVALNQDDPPPIGQPGAGAWQVSAGLIAASGKAVSALIVSGLSDDDYAQFIRFEYWRSDGVTAPEAVTSWTEAGTTGPDAVRFDITGLAEGAQYYVAVSYLVGGEPGARRILGPVAAPASGGDGLRLLADRSQVKYDGAGEPTPAAQTTTFSVLKQAINSPVAIVVARSDGTLPPLSIGSYFTALDGGAEVLNRAVDSIDFSAWTANAATVTPAAATAPDGTRTASLVEDSGIADNGAISQTIAIPVDSATYNVSIYVKKTVGAAASAMLRVNMGGGLDPLPQASKDAILNTNTGAVRGLNAQNIRADSVGDYWRLSFDAANNGTNSVATYIFYPAIGLNQGDEAALGPDPAATGAAHAWGMQIGDQPGQPHVPTAGAARTALLSNSVRITEPGFAAARGATNGLIVQAIASEPGGVLTDYAGLVAVGDGAPGFDGAAGIDGIDGADGKLVEFVWRRAATQPDTPTGNGIPAGWFDDPPAGSDPLWLSKAKQELDGTLVAGEAWSAPIRHDGPAGPPGAPGAPGATGVSIRKIWQRSTTQPATPAASDATPAGWFDTPGAASGSGTLWATTGERAAGAVNFTWTTPVRDEAITSTNTGQFVVLGFTVSETISFTLSPGQSRQIFGQANLSSPTGGGSAHVQIESRLNGGAWSASNGPSEPYAVGEPAVLEHSITITNSALVSANYQVRGTVIRSNTSSGSLVTSSSQLSI